MTTNVNKTSNTLLLIYIYFLSTRCEDLKISRGIANENTSIHNELSQSDGLVNQKFKNPCILHECYTVIIAKTKINYPRDPH